MKRDNIDSLTKKSGTLQFLFGGILSLVFPIPIFYHLYTDPVFSLTMFFIGTLFSLLTLYLFYKFVYGLFFKISIREDEIILNRFLSRKVIRRKSLSKYIIKRQLNGDECAHIFTEKEKFVITNYYLKNYEAVKSAIIRGLNNGTQNYLSKSRKRTIPYLYLFLFFFSFIYIFLSIKLGKDFFYRPFDKSLLIEVEGTLAEDVKIIDENKSDENITLKIIEHPELRFCFEQDFYDVLKRNTLAAFGKKGEKIQISVLNDDYEEYIAKEIPESFFNKYISNPGKISVYELKMGFFELLKTEDFDNMKSSRKAKTKAVFFFIIITVAYFYAYRKLFHRWVKATIPFIRSKNS